jgi:hypothetical protein
MRVLLNMVFLEVIDGKVLPKGALFSLKTHENPEVTDFR